MRLTWTEAAVADLERIADYLFEQTPLHAPRIVQMIHDSPMQLLAFPALGRLGKVNGTRELVLTSLPYIVVYSLSGDVVHVARILHGAQKWP